jgi:hypothetical protein
MWVLSRVQWPPYCGAITCVIVLVRRVISGIMPQAQPRANADTSTTQQWNFSLHGICTGNGSVQAWKAQGALSVPLRTTVCNQHCLALWPRVWAMKLPGLAQAARTALDTWTDNNADRGIGRPLFTSCRTALQHCAVIWSQVVIPWVMGGLCVESWRFMPRPAGQQLICHSCCCRTPLTVRVIVTSTVVQQVSRRALRVTTRLTSLNRDQRGVMMALVLTRC